MQDLILLVQACSVSVHPPTSCTANVISGRMYFLQSAFIMNDKMQDLVLASFPAIRYSLIDSLLCSYLFSFTVNSLLFLLTLVKDFDGFTGSLGVGKGEGVLSSFLPGICLSLCELVTSDTLIGQVKI